MANQYLWIVFTNISSLRSVIRLFFSALMLAVTPIANAVVITLEPDDFGVGASLENAYVRTAYVDNSAVGQPWENALTAVDRRGHDPEYAAPTGNLIFGAFAFLVYDNFPGPGLSYGGLGFKFNQDVSRVTLLANSLYTPGDLAAVWAAFDIDGNRITSGHAGGDRPASETFEIDIRATGIRSLIIGGDVGTAAICFDNLIFEFDEASTVISEPNLIVLFLMGFIIIMVRAQSAAQSK